MRCRWRGGFRWRRPNLSAGLGDRTSAGLGDRTSESKKGHLPPINRGHACKSSCTRLGFSCLQRSSNLRLAASPHARFLELLSVSGSRSLVFRVPLAGSCLSPGPSRLPASGSPLGSGLRGGGRGWAGGDLPGAIPASCPLLAAPQLRGCGSDQISGSVTQIYPEPPETPCWV
jgi:hypothetical protein